MATQISIGQKLLKAWDAVRKPADLDLDKVNEVLNVIRSKLSIHRFVNSDAQDCLPVLIIEPNLIKERLGQAPIKETRIEIYGVGNLGGEGRARILCHGESISELDQIQKALVYLTADEHKSEIQKLVTDARNKVYPKNSVRRFIKEFQSLGCESAA